MASIFLRKYQSGDEEAYTQIWNETYKMHRWFQRHGPMTVEEARRKIHECTKDPTYELSFAVVNNKAAGFLESKMEDVETGVLMNYQPCVLPDFRQQNAAAKLVNSAIGHLQGRGAKKAKFSIMGFPEDTTYYVNLYRNLGFDIWREGFSMAKKLDNIPSPECSLTLKLCTARETGTEAFVNHFMKCFRDSKDRDASIIASSAEKTKQFIQSMRIREGENPDLNGWITAYVEDEFAGFAIAISERGNGLIAEVGVVPRLRSQGIGGKLTVKALQRLKERGFEQVFLGVDKQNTPAIALYEKLGFQKLDWQILELERSLR